MKNRIYLKGSSVLVIRATLMNLFVVGVFISSVIVAGPIRNAVAGRGFPPVLSEPIQNKIRIPFGTKQLRLVCPVKAGNEDIVMIQWKKDDEHISFDYNTRFKLLRDDRELKIRNPQLTDSGAYQCQAVNGFGHLELDFDVLIYDSENENKEIAQSSTSISDKDLPPTWLNEMEMRNLMLTPVRLSIGSELHLKCPSKGNPFPEVTWFHNNDIIESERFSYQHTMRSLIISNAQPSNSGKYICQLKNIHGMIQGVFHVHIGDFFNADDDMHWSSEDGGALDQSPIIDEPLNSTVRAGHTAQFQCKVKSHHQPLIKWLKQVDNLDRINEHNKNSTFIHANNMDLLLLDQPQTKIDSVDGIYVNRLVIPNVKHENAGTYICVVTNAVGEIVYRSTHLEVASRYNGISSFYFYVGMPVIFLIFSFIVYAIYFLCRNQENLKQDSSEYSSTVKPVPSDQSSSSIRPPPPNHPPPCAPHSPNLIEKHNNACYPLLPISEKCAINMRSQPSLLDKKRSTPISQPRPTPVRRTRAVEDTTNFYDTSSTRLYLAEPQILVSHETSPLHMDHPNFKNFQYNFGGNFQNYVDFQQSPQRQLTFSTPVLQRRSLGFV